MQIVHFDIRPGFVYLDEHRYVIKVLGMYYCSYFSDIDLNDLPVSDSSTCCVTTHPVYLGQLGHLRALETHSNSLICHVLRLLLVQA